MGTKKEKAVKTEKKAFAGFKEVGGFENKFFVFKEEGDTFEGIYLETKTIQKNSKFAKKGKKVEVEVYICEGKDGARYQFENRGNLKYRFDEADLKSGAEIKVVYNGKKDGSDGKAYHNYSLFVKE